MRARHDSAPRDGVPARSRCARAQRGARPVRRTEQSFRVSEAHYNLGVAHGVPGVVGLLSRCVELGIEANRAAGLLRETVRWIRGEQCLGQESRFPSWTVPNQPSVPARAAWCYGDPGIAATQLAASRALEDAELEIYATTVAEDAATRTIEVARVVDPGICHGSAGLSLIFQRMALRANSATLAEAALTWARRATDGSADLAPGAAPGTLLTGSLSGIGAFGHFAGVGQVATRVSGRSGNKPTCAPITAAPGCVT